MALDGLEDAYERGKAMGVFAEECVAKYGFSARGDGPVRDRAPRARQGGQRGRQLRLGNGAGDGRRRKAATTVIKFDEQPFKAKLDKIPGLKPAFKKDGTITAATLVEHLRRRRGAGADARIDGAKLGLKPIARIVGHAVHAQAPDWFTTAPVGAIQKVLQKTGWDAKEVDLWEVNEAFAAVTMAAMDEFKLPHEIVNVHGGAVRARPPDRRLGRAHRRHAARRVAQAGQEARRRGAVHRRRRSDGDGGRDAVIRCTPPCRRPRSLRSSAWASQRRPWRCCCTRRTVLCASVLTAPLFAARARAECRRRASTCC